MREKKDARADGLCGFSRCHLVPCKPETRDTDDIVMWWPVRMMILLRPERDPYYRGIMSSLQRWQS